ncbi:MAG: HlyD family efflux transporter periplasmic adaptor subunit [Gammaproteobacteria bacterium]|nr:HlyD family efflux transporter periplasmic adaptor subunit [Gammaproteobacteria bacterium]
MSDARRRFQSARISLNTARRRLDRVSFLLEEGIIPASEYESAKQQYDSLLLDFDAAQDAFELIMSKDNDDARRVALLEVENSKSRLDDIRGRIANSTIEAPISGLVQPAAGKDAGPLTTGRPLSTGELLLTIANFEQIVVETTVDEVDVNKIKPNQTAWISGPGFPDERLGGSVRHVASKTRFQTRHGNPPQFQITVELKELNPFQRERLRVGMSAHVTIVIYSNAQAIMVPLESVEQFGNAARIRVLDPSGNIVERIVETGLTTLDSVEVLHGLDAGEQIVLSSN